MLGGSRDNYVKKTEVRVTGAAQRQVKGQVLIISSVLAASCGLIM